MDRLVKRLIDWLTNPDQPLDVEQQVKKIIADLTCTTIDTISTSMHLYNDLCLDSMDYFVMMLELEEKFCLPSFEDQKIAEFQTVGDIIYYIQQLIQQEYETRL